MREKAEVVSLNEGLQPFSYSPIEFQCYSLFKETLDTAKLELVFSLHLNEKSLNTAPHQWLRFGRFPFSLYLR